MARLAIVACAAALGVAASGGGSAGPAPHAPAAAASIDPSVALVRPQSPIAPEELRMVGEGVVVGTLYMLAHNDPFACRFFTRRFLADHYDLPAAAARRRCRSDVPRLRTNPRPVRFLAGRVRPGGGEIDALLKLRGGARIRHRFGLARDAIGRWRIDSLTPLGP